MPDHRYGMTWTEAHTVALAGLRVRRNGWRRWISLVSGSTRLWLSHSGTTVAIVLASEFTAEEFRATDWTTAPWPGEAEPPVPAVISNTVAIARGESKRFTLSVDRWISLGRPSSYRVGIGAAINDGFVGEIKTSTVVASCVGRGACAVMLTGITLVGRQLAAVLKAASLVDTVALSGGSSSAARDLALGEAAVATGVSMVFSQLIAEGRTIDDGGAAGNGTMREAWNFV